MKRKVTSFERSQLPAWSSIACSVLNDVRNRKIFVNCGDSSTFLMESECIRAISQTVRESPVRNLFLSCIIGAEQQSPGSSYVAMSMISGTTCDHDVGRRFQIHQLRESLSMMIGAQCTGIVMDAITLAGRRGKIILDASESQSTEISCGTQVCKWRPESAYFTSLNQQKVSVQNCKVVFVDGIIESVSECHRLFHDSCEKGLAVVIFARGFAEEVVATAAVNMQRRTAQVIPIPIPFDEVGVNGMGDLAGCFAAELISSDKGQLVSSIDLESCASADRISCTSAGTEIELKDSRTTHVIQRLTSKLGCVDHHQSDLIRRRLDVLGNNAVCIKVGHETKSLRGIQRDRIDFGIRYVKSCMEHGVLNFDGMLLPSSSVRFGSAGLRSFESIIGNSKVMLEVEGCG